MNTIELMLRACQEDWDVVMDIDAEYDRRLMCATRIGLLRVAMGHRGDAIDDLVFNSDGLMTDAQRESVCDLLADTGMRMFTEVTGG